MYIISSYIDFLLFIFFFILEISHRGIGGKIVMMSRYFERDYETQENKVLKISQYEIGGVGHIVWDAAIVLAKYLEKQIKNNKLNIKNKQEKKKFIELGAGTGIVGLVLASYEFVFDLCSCLTDIFISLSLNLESI